jgi:thiamine transport system permease protein
VGTLGAILAAHVFYNTTIVIRLVGSALSQLDPKLEAAARTLGASSRRVWWYVTLPLLRPSLLAAGLLVFLFDFTSFGVILLLGGPGFATLEVETYIQALQMLNLPLAGLLSAVQLLCTLVFSVLYTRAVARTSVQVNPRAAQYNLRRARNLQEKVFVHGLGFLLILFFVLPMLALPLRSVSRLEAARGQRGEVQYGLTDDYYQELFINRRGSLFYVPPVRAALNSLGYAGVTVLLSLLMGFPAASALARPGKLERWLDPLLVLPLGASAVTLGLGFILSVQPAAICACCPRPGWCRWRIPWWRCPSSSARCSRRWPPSPSACGMRPPRWALRLSAPGWPWTGRSSGARPWRRRPLRSRYPWASSARRPC